VNSQSLALQREMMHPPTRKKKHVDLGSKGSFTIKHPGDFRRRAQAAGESTAAFAQKEKGAGGKVGREARSAIGLMAMAKKTRGKK